MACSEHIQRLIDCRQKADILNSPLAVTARTNAETATLIDSNIDPLDHPHIKGATAAGMETMREGTMNGMDDDWKDRAGGVTFPDLAAKATKTKGTDQGKIDNWLKQSWR